MSDTTDRDRLGLTISAYRRNAEVAWDEDMRLADHLLNLGWRPPARVVTTVEELDALAVGTVVMEGDHGTPDDTGWGFKTMPGVFHRFPEGWHVVAGHGQRVPDLPATVLWTPEDQA